MSAAEQLLTERLLLRAPTAGMMQAAIDYQRRNVEHLRPWDPPMPADYNEPDVVTTRLTQGALAFAAGTAYRYWFSLRDDPARLIGSIHMSQVARFAFQNTILGYSLDAEAQGRGLMHEALQAVIAEMFGTVGLHRIQAAVLPKNARSRAVLQRLGFVQEGLSRRYLFIDGQWRDHEVYALLNPDWPDTQAP